MNASLSGLSLLAGYIVMVGIASFLEKFSMKQLNPYQVNFLMAIGMAITAVPALWIKQGSLTVPTKALPLGAPIGLLMALGSICFGLSLSKLPVGMATAIRPGEFCVALVHRVPIVFRAIHYFVEERQPDLRPEGFAVHEDFRAQVMQL